MKKKLKKCIPFLLIASLLITGALAFLSASDSKINRFTVGKVDVELHEDNWYDHDSNIVLDDENKNGVPDFADDLVAGKKIEKAPYAENTGRNNETIIMTVSVPTATSAQIYATDPSGDFVLSDDDTLKTQQVVVKVYAFQEGYAESTNPATVWNAYSGGNAEIFGAAASDVSDRIELFTFVKATTDGNNNKVADFTENGAHSVNENWLQIGEVYKAADGNNYYVFAYVEGATGSETLKVHPVATGDTESNTNTLFDYVVFNTTVGDIVSAQTVTPDPGQTPEPDPNQEP